jgi:hypothetical protein
MLWIVNKKIQSILSSVELRSRVEKNRVQEKDQSFHLKT